ncbi:MAG: ABC transporter permease [Bacteroidota bacterium]
MFRNFIKITFRNLWKNKGYSAINISGMMVAFCISSLLLFTAYFQLTFDNFHQHSKQIYQAYFVANENGVINRSGETPIPMVSAMKAELADISQIASVNSGRNSVITANNKSIEKLVTYTDADFLKMFTFPLIEGSANTALNDLHNIVISKSTSEALFGKVNPLGKQMSIGKLGSEINYIISGVVEDCPANSSIKFDILCRIESKPDYFQTKDNWQANASNIYVRLNDQSNVSDVEKKLERFSKKYFPVEKSAVKSSTLDIKLQPLSKIHFDNAISGGKGVPVALVYALMILAIFIILIACFNFINLNIAKHLNSTREMGVRKTLGASKYLLFIQLWGESFMVCFIGFGLGIFLLVNLLPIFKAYFNAKIELQYMLQPSFIALMSVIFLIVTFIAGGYPAYKMSRLPLITALKGKISNEKGILRKSLIISQFSISSLLICIALIANQQLDYLKEKPLGFEKEQVISIPVGSQIQGRMMLEKIRTQFSNDASILSISGSDLNLGKGKDRVTSRTTVDFDFRGNNFSVDWINVDGDFMTTMGIKLLEGQVQKHENYAANSVWISESLMKGMGNNKVLNTFLDPKTNANQIVGVFQDFNLYAPSQATKPVVMQFSKQADINYIFLRVKTELLSSAMQKMKIFWKNNGQGTEFMGSFLNENVESWYQEENTITQIFSVASAIAIFLSCMGLFAVSLLIIEQRTKEIGVRKVMGASVQSIVWMLSKYFLKFILIAFCIALPLGWFAMNSWLQSYAYRIEIGALPFVMVIVGITTLSIITISFQAIKAALANPVKSLRTE